MLSTPRAGGFTMVELMVGISILAIVLAIGIPGYTAYLQGSKLASAAQSYMTGLQLARAEAIRRNLPVEFVLTDLQVDVPNVQNSGALLNPTGRSWVVRVLDPLTGNFDLVAAKSALEGSYSSAGVPSVLVNGAATAPAVFDGRVPFNGFGSTTTNAAYTLDVQSINGGACAPAGPMRCPRIRVLGGGRSFVCDPIVAAGDSRAC